MSCVAPLEPNRSATESAKLLPPNLGGRSPVGTRVQFLVPGPLHFSSCWFSVPFVVDVLTPEQRRRCMASIRGKDTAPEVLVGKLVRALGYSFKTHASDLPSKPDIVLRSLRKAILVHGCFWHRHSCKLGRVLPQTRAAFWRTKLLGNKDRDARNLRTLRRLGWKVFVIWECQTREPTRVLSRLAVFLRG